VSVSERDTLIIELRIPPQQTVLFQGLLSGEDGLGVLRCRDPERRLQQLWTTVAQRQMVHDWLTSLPTEIGVEVVDERLWREGE